MKNTLLIFAFITFIGIYSSCRPKAEKVDSEKAKLEAAEHEFRKEYDQLKLSWEKQFRENQLHISEIRSNGKRLKGGENAFREKTMEELEKQNQALSKKLRNYTYRGIKDWQKFKNAFRKDAQELGNALKGADSE